MRYFTPCTLRYMCCFIALLLSNSHVAIASANSASAYIGMHLERSIDKDKNTRDKNMDVTTSSPVYLIPAAMERAVTLSVVTASVTTGLVSKYGLGAAVELGYDYYNFNDRADEGSSLALDGIFFLLTTSYCLPLHKNKNTAEVDLGIYAEAGLGTVFMVDGKLIYRINLGPSYIDAVQDVARTTVDHYKLRAGMLFGIPNGIQIQVGVCATKVGNVKIELKSIPVYIETSFDRLALDVGAKVLF